MPATASLFSTSLVGTPTGTTWANTANAVGSTTGTNATFVTSTASAVGTITLAIENIKTSTLTAQPQSIDSIVVTLRHFNTTTATGFAVKAQLMYGGIALGAAQSITTMPTAVTNQTLTFSGTSLPMYSQLDLFRVIITVTKDTVASTSRQYNLDTVSAVINYTSKSDTSEYTIFEPSVAPTGVGVVGTGAGGVLGHEFFVTAQRWCRGIRFYRPSTSVTGTITARLYLVRTGTTGDPYPLTDVTLTLAATPASGWFEMRFSKSVRLQPGQRYRVAVYFPSGRPDIPNYWVFSTANTGAGGGAGNLLSGGVTMPVAASSTGGMQEQYQVTAGQGTAGLVYPDSSNSQNGCACIDVITSSTQGTGGDIGPLFLRTIGTNTTATSTATSLAVTIPAGGTGEGSLIIARLAGWGYPSATDQGDVLLANSEANLFYGDFAAISSSAGVNRVLSCINAPGKVFASGDTLTFSFPQNCHNLVMSIEEYNGVYYSSPSDGSWRVITSVSASGTSLTPGTALTPPQYIGPESLVTGTLFIPAANTETYTEDNTTDGGAPWVNIGGVYSATGARQQAMRTSYKLPVDVDASQTWDPVLGQNRTWIAVIALYRGVADTGYNSSFYPGSFA